MSREQTKIREPIGPPKFGSQHAQLALVMIVGCRPMVCALSADFGGDLRGAVALSAGTTADQVRVALLEPGLYAVDDILNGLPSWAVLTRADPEEWSTEEPQSAHPPAAPGAVPAWSRAVPWAAADQWPEGGGSER